MRGLSPFVASFLRKNSWTRPIWSWTLSRVMGAYGSGSASADGRLDAPELLLCQSPGMIGERGWDKGNGGRT